MAVIHRQNQYRGVNAHLHSYFQNEGTRDWEGFHGAYIVDMARALNDLLVPAYLVRLDRSLQIREFHPTTGERIRRPIPDLLIMEGQPGMPRASSRSAAAPTATLPVMETLNDDQEYLLAVVIEDAETSLPVTHIELLSPTNKPPGEGAVEYSAKRELVLRSGLPMVEIDYMHQTRSPITRMPNYSRGQAGAYPYTITVTDPRPTLQQGQARIYGFQVDDPIPVIDPPLKGEETLIFDFGAVYQRTFSSLATFYMQVDYEQLPAAFERYQPFDQQRILELQRLVLENATDSAL
ncbi:MAG: DUF4058 family protein [bacterium]|nr:DUF4058 family protein [bacterium]